MKYKVGDKVRVRRWESMEKEFGIDEDGNIDMNTPVFVPLMKEYCGRIVEISKNIHDTWNRHYYEIKEDNEEWRWTDEMLEPVEFDWELFKDKSNKIAVHCKTEEEAKDFCRQMHEHGMEWLSGNSYLEYTNFDVYKEETCYGGRGKYYNRKWYENRKYKILEYADYFTKEKQKSIIIPKKCRRILKQLNKDYKWIAKDKNDKVYIYTKEPVRDLYEWVSQGRKERIDELFPKLDYSWLSFEDYAPVNFREVLKGE